MQYTNEQVEKIKEISLYVTEVKELLDDTLSKNWSSVEEDLVSDYKKQIDEFNKSVPGVLNTVNINELFSQRYNCFSTQTFLMRVKRDFATLKTKLNVAQASPIMVTKDFSFVTNNKLKIIIERDYNYLNKCLVTEAWKPVIILAGGLVEALLLDKLLTDETKAKSSHKAPKENDLKKWDLDKLIDVAVDLEIINLGVEKFSDAVRHYRNLVHPGRELSSGLKIEPQEAKIAVEILEILIRDLGK